MPDFPDLATIWEAIKAQPLLLINIVVAASVLLFMGWMAVRFAWWILTPVRMLTMSYLLFMARICIGLLTAIIWLLKPITWALSPLTRRLMPSPAKAEYRRQWRREWKESESSIQPMWNPPGEESPFDRPSGDYDNYARAVLERAKESGTDIPTTVEVVLRDLGYAPGTDEWAGARRAVTARVHGFEGFDPTATGPGTDPPALPPPFSA